MASRDPAAARDPAALRERVARGRAHYLAGEYAEAIALLTDVLRDKVPYADVYDMLGVMYHQEGRLAEAEEMFREALRINPAYTEAALNLVVTCNDLGNTRREMGDVPGAVRELEHVRAESPRFVAGRLQLGLAYHASGRRDDAAAEWRAAQELAPGNRAARMYLSLLDVKPPAG